MYFRKYNTNTNKNEFVDRYLTTLGLIIPEVTNNCFFGHWHGVRDTILTTSLYYIIVVKSKKYIVWQGYLSR